MNRNSSAEKSCETVLTISARYRRLLLLWLVNLNALIVTLMATWLWNFFYLIAAGLALCFGALALGHYLLKGLRQGSFFELAEDSE